MALDQLSAFPCASNVDAQSGNLLLLLLNALMASQCSLKNSTQYPKDKGLDIQDGDHFDFIVVGAGSAGSVVGSKLVQDGKWRVLVLEAGDIPSVTSEIPLLAEELQKSTESTNHFTLPSKESCLGMKHGSCHWPRGKVLGGCSSINSMLYVRGNKANFDEWAENGNKNWEYENVMKYFKEIEKLLPSNYKGSSGNYGLEGLLPLFKYSENETLRDVILESAKELNLNLLDEDGEEGFMETPLTTNGKVRANAAKIFLGSVKDSDKLTLALNAQVTKLIINKKTKKTEGVEVQIGNKLLKLFADKEVILSAGAINSPQILMLSGIGPKEHLKKFNLDVIQDTAVGLNLQDHLTFLMLVKLNDEAIQIKNEKESLDEIYNYFVHNKGELSTMGITNIQGYINTNNASKYPDIQLMYGGVPKGDPFLEETYMRNLNFKEKIAKTIIDFGKDSNILLTLVILLQPKSIGKISLKTTDPFDTVEIETGYLTDNNNEDLEVLLKGIRFAQTQLSTESFKRHNAQVLDVVPSECRKFEFDSDEYWKCAIRHISTTMYHPTSTCKMGPYEDADAVVDDRLRVHGVKSLRVIDASIMPRITSGNTNAPSIMIGYKGAEMILEDYRSVHNEL